MKHLILPFLFVISTHFAGAQNNDWFKGRWNGIKSVTGARIGIRVLVRIEVDSVDSNRFSGRFIYMYPKDTMARLIKTFTGDIKKGFVRLDKSKEIYLFDPRTRGFWSNCSQCNETTSLSLSDSNLVFKIITTNCGDSCNGETVFSRNIYRYDPSMQTKIKKLFTQEKTPVTAKINTKQKNNNTKAAKKSLSDTSKNNQPVTKLNNKKAINTKDTVAKNAASTQTFKVAKKDSLPQAKINRETNLRDTNQVTAKINPNQKDKNIQAAKKSLADTSKNNLPSTKLNNRQAGNKKDSVAKTSTSTQTFKVANNDSLQQVKADHKTNLIDTNHVDPSTAVDNINPNTYILPQALIDRTTSLINTFQVDSPHIRIDLFDNGEIDSDIVSVYYNGKLIINSVTLTDKPITFFIDATAEHRYHEFILIAENEGSIPPNTALLRIIAGGKQYKVPVSTSGTRNAKIAIDYLGY